MGIEKKCLKCDHVSQFASPTDAVACQQCGAIYAKVEAALKNDGFVTRPPMRAAAPAPTQTPAAHPKPTPQATTQTEAGFDPATDLAAYGETLRAESLYPTFRSLVQFMYQVGLVVTGVIIIGMLANLYFNKSNVLVTLCVGVFLAAFNYLAARVGKEMFSMIADLSDASVRLAAAQEKSARTS